MLQVMNDTWQEIGILVHPRSGNKTTLDWVTYTQTFISPSSGSLKSRIKVPSDLVSGESQLSNQLSFHCNLLDKNGK